MKQKIPALLLIFGVVILLSSLGQKEAKRYLYAGKDPKVHSGATFVANYSTVEHGTKTVSFISAKKQKVKAINPTASWHKAYPAATCNKDQTGALVCIASATALPTFSQKIGPAAALIIVLLVLGLVFKNYMQKEKANVIYVSGY